MKYLTYVRGSTTVYSSITEGARTREDGGNVHMPLYKKNSKSTKKKKQRREGRYIYIKKKETVLFVMYVDKKYEMSNDYGFSRHLV